MPVIIYCDDYGSKSYSCSNGALCDCIAGVRGSSCSALGRITDELLYITNGFYTGDFCSDFCDATTYAYAFNQRAEDSNLDPVSVCEIIILWLTLYTLYTLWRLFQCSKL